MKPVKYLLFAFITILCAISLCSFFRGPSKASKSYKFPYKIAGLNQRQAAEHLLDRFTYGATTRQIDAVVNIGLEKWFDQQLNASLPDDSLKQMLGKYDALKLSNAEAVNKFPKPFIVQQMALRDGIIKQPEVSNDLANNTAYRDKLLVYMQSKGLKLQIVLYQQFVNQKILRAAYSQNQLQEVLTDFWFNHFNVSLTKPDCAEYVPAYERDVIRPNALGKFDRLLLATAKSPAMLYYLDNFSSAGPNQNNAADMAGMKMIAQNMAVKNDTNYTEAKVVKFLQQNNKTQGLNENYAREVMELHTLGVDGGYTQQDVTQAAKILTGWTAYPVENYGYQAAIKKVIDSVGETNLTRAGFVHDGDFFFAMNRHDKSEKMVLGHHFGSNGGYQEGVDLLEMLAHHPSTARFICHKLAVKFVCDTPSAALINKMAKTFTDQDGDIKQVLITMVSSPEFWSTQSLRQKTKSPFELAISAVRNLNAQLTMPYQLYPWLDKMGQKLYSYAAPTGFPDNGQYWINTGSILTRMNFGLALASNRIQGVNVDLAALNNNHEPESPEAALETYCKLIMPERNLNETVKRLKPLLTDPKLIDKIDQQATSKQMFVKNSMVSNSDLMTDDNTKNTVTARMKKTPTVTLLPGNMLSQVVGVIIGSPEFQRK